MSETGVIGNLGDIPDLSGISDTRPEFQPFENGWYRGVIQEKREFTDKNGNDRVFESVDAVSQRGDSRNIRLQIELTRTDGKKLNLSTLINYKPSVLSQETLQAVAAHREKVNGEGAEWGELFGAFMTLNRLAKLQKIAGVRQLQRTTDGGLDLQPLYGKTAYFRIGDDKRNPQYKEVADFQDYAPKKAGMLL